MRIAVSATGNNLDATVSPVFGRCPYFIIVDVEGNEIKKYEAIKNPGAGAVGGAGIQAAQTIANRKVEVVISGNVGPNAFAVLSTTGIKVVTGVSGITVRDAIQKYLRGELKETEVTPTSRPNLSVSPVPSRGRGFGGPTECVCPNCGFRMPHQRGVPCFQHICPRCGSRMVRG